MKDKDVYEILFQLNIIHYDLKFFYCQEVKKRVVYLEDGGSKLLLNVVD